MELAAALVGGCSRGGGVGENTFCLFKIFLEVYIFLLLCGACVIDIAQVGWTVCKSATELQLVLVTVSCC